MGNRRCDAVWQLGAAILLAASLVGCAGGGSDESLGDITSSDDPSCVRGIHQPARLPVRPSEYAPRTWPYTAQRLARDNGYLVPSIKLFVERIEGLRSADDRKTWRETMLSNVRIADYRALSFPSGVSGVSEPPFVAPSPVSDRYADINAVVALARVDRQSAYRPTTIGEYVAAYRAGTTTPAEVAERLIAAAALESASLTALSRTGHGVFTAVNAALLRAAAAESTVRWAEGRARPLEGVPIVVKDQMDASGLPTSVGTIWRNQVMASSDAAVVAAAREAGALIVGKTNMHELGGGVTGMNPHWGAVKNPYDTARMGGGSSGGSAVAVLLGLVPAAIGSDAGGSVRVPAAFTGTFALKPTYGRFSNAGIYPVADSLTQPGPMAATAQDLAALYYAMLDPSGGEGAHQSLDAIDLSRFHADGSPLQIGVLAGWNAQADSAVRTAVTKATGEMVRRGAKLHTLDTRGKGVPKLEWSMIAQTLLFATAMSEAARADPFYNPSGTSPEQRIAISMGTLSTMSGRSSDLGPADLIVAEKVREELIRSLESIFCSGIDVIVTPATATLPPYIRADAFPHGESDIAELDRIAFYSTLANMTGHPAVVIPIGTDSSGMPIAIQLIGRSWSETDLLRLARAMESYYRRPTPGTTYTPLAP